MNEGIGIICLTSKIIIYLRYLDADTYFQSLHKNKPQFHQKQMSSEYLVVVITKKRFMCDENKFHCEPHYLQQTLAALDRESRIESVNAIVPVVVCSVDPQWKTHQDLHDIMNDFPIIFRYHNTNDQIATNKAQETTDYAFCLEEASVKFGKATKYLIVVEDDAIVFENFFITLSSILKNRVETKMLRGERISNERLWCWMKLYYPEFWCGFGFDGNRLMELFWIAVVGAMIGSLIAFIIATVKRTKISVHRWACYGAVNLILLAIIISRQTLLEIRRINSTLMQVTPDSGCCSTVVVLYPMEEIPNIVTYLRSNECKRCQDGVDLAIRDYKDKFGMLGLLVQPNLARHIGLHSTVSADYKDPVQMMFYDML